MLGTEGHRQAPLSRLASGSRYCVLRLTWVLPIHRDLRPAPSFFISRLEAIGIGGSGLELGRVAPVGRGGL